MSAKNFYQTFYQTDQLFRVANEPWAVVESVAVEEIADEPVAADPVVEPAFGLLADLDALSAVLESVEMEKRLVDSIIEVPVTVMRLPEPEPIIVTTTPEPLPEPVTVIAAPEPLPLSVPRPSTPSILPPQQRRMPQLNHKVLLLADEELDPSNLLFLEKILKAVNLNIDGVDLLNLHGVRDMHFDELLRGKYINHFITFGVPFERINLDIMMDRYAPVRFEGITFLMADSLPTVEADLNLKKRLWTALQRVFLQQS